jgi:hypothetical protein
MTDERLSEQPLKLFYSYAHRDEEYRERLETALAMLRRQGVVSEWHDRRIVPGTPWGDEISQHLEEADLIVLLVSPDFLASEYCFDIETKRALQRHEEGSARVIPIIVRVSDWKVAQFAKLQALPKDSKAVRSWTDPDEAWQSVTEGIRATVTELRQQRS